MKKFAYASVLAVALVAIVSTAAFAGGEHPQAKKAVEKAAAAATGEMGKGCVAAAAEGKCCCGKDAGALKADYEKKIEGEAKKMASK